MLHTDFGIVYLGFSTDTQHNAYVLKPGETDAPQGLKDGLKAANRLQDITMRFATPGNSGNEALRAARTACDQGRSCALDLLASRRLSRSRRRDRRWG